MLEPRANSKVYLHRVLDEDGESGYLAWIPSCLGFATWGETENEVLAKVPEKLLEYIRFRERFGVPCPAGSRLSEVEVAERVSGNEILFDWDYLPATPSLIDETIGLLHATRTHLLSLVAGLSDDALDWNPPYRRFSTWANWRTIRQILVHIANAETHYYLPNIGIHPAVPPAGSRDPWKHNLRKHRNVTTEALRKLKAEQDLSRVHFFDAEGGWSVGKVLRRLVWHERLHFKSIERIIGVYQAQGQ